MFLRTESWLSHNYPFFLGGILLCALTTWGTPPVDELNNTGVAKSNGEPLPSKLMTDMLELQGQHKFREAQFMGRMALVVMTLDLDHENCHVFANYLAAQARLEFEMQNSSFALVLMELSNSFPARAEVTSMDTAAFYWTLALCYADEGMFHQANETLDEHCDLEVVRQTVGDAVFAELLSSKARVRLASGDMSGAVVTLARAGRVNASMRNDRSCGYWIALAEIRFAQERLDDALCATESVLQWCRADSISTSRRFVGEALLFKARILTKCQRNAEAVTAYREAIEAYASRLGNDSDRVKQLQSEMELVDKTKCSSSNGVRDSNFGCWRRERRESLQFDPTKDRGGQITNKALTSRSEGRAEPMVKAFVQDPRDE